MPIQNLSFSEIAALNHECRRVRDVKKSCWEILKRV